MIVISKKRILIITSLIFTSLFAFVLQNADKENTIATVALPVSNKVIVLDAGHGKPDERSRKYCSGRLKRKLI